ncbi:unnamed protein product, partial [Ectocarpus fasciculatus]
ARLGSSCVGNACRQIDLAPFKPFCFLDQPCCRRVENRVSLAKESSVLMVASCCTEPDSLHTTTAVSPPRQPPPTTRFHRPQNTRFFHHVPTSGLWLHSFFFSCLRGSFPMRCHLVLRHVRHSCVFLSLWDVGHRP